MMALLGKMNHDFEGVGSKYLHHDKKDDFTNKKEGGERRHSFVPLAPPPSQVGPIVYGQFESYDQKAPYSQQAGPPGSNSLPPGWTQEWDKATQRWCYVERSSGKTQWDQPLSSSPRPIGFLPLGHENDHHRRGSSTSGYSGRYGQSPPSAAQFSQPLNGESKEGKTNGHTGMLAGAAGGFAVGAVGGGLVGSAVHDSDSSDDEQRHQRVGVPVPYGQGQNHSQGEQHDNGSALQHGYGHSRTALPDEPASGHSVSSSNKESVQEAREKYDKADASDDKEEALEEYKEKYGKAYVDD